MSRFAYLASMRRARMASRILRCDRALGAEEGLRDLLGDRRAALRDLAGAQVRAQRARDAAQVEAAVLVEAAILGGEEGVDEPGRDLLERQDLAALGGELGEGRAVPGADHRRERRGLVVGREVRQRGQRRREVDVDAQQPEQRKAEHAQQRERVELEEPVEEAAVGGVRDLDVSLDPAVRWGRRHRHGPSTLARGSLGIAGRPLLK